MPNQLRSIPNTYIQCQIKAKSKKIDTNRMPNHENQSKSKQHQWKSMQNLCQIMNINRSLFQINENRHQIDAQKNPSSDRSIGAIATPRHRQQIHAQIIEIDATCMPNHWNRYKTQSINPAQLEDMGRGIMIGFNSFGREARPPALNTTKLFNACLQSGTRPAPQWPHQLERHGMRIWEELA